MEPIRVGFIGCGAVAELHYEALRACSQARLVSIYDIDAGKLQDRMKEWGVRGHSSVEELVSRDDVDAVFVLSPVQFHHEHAIAALRQGKHVLVEKPVADSRRDIEAMRDMAERQGLVCMPAHNYIYSPDLIRIKKHLELGHLGKVAASWILFNIHHDEQLRARYPGVIKQIGTHLLYTHRYLFGAPEAVSVHGTSFLNPDPDKEDQAAFTLAMPDGSIGNLFVSFAVSDQSSNPWTFIVKALGTKGSAQWSWQDAVFERELGTLSRSYVHYEETYEKEVEYFIRRCVLKGESPLSTLDDAAAVMELVREAELSAKRNRSERRLSS